MSTCVPAATVARRRAMGRARHAARIIALLGVAAPAWAGPPYVTDDPDTPDKGHFEINFAGTYTLNRNEQSGNIPSVEVNYGLTDHIQLTVFTPLAFQHPTGGASVAGLGDVEFEVKWRFLDADDWGWRPSLAIAPTIIAPTGNASRELGTGRTQAFLPIILGKDFGKFTVFASAGYQINPGQDNRNFWFTGVGVTYEIDPKWTVGAEVFRTTADTTDGTSSVGFNLGLTYNFDDTNHLLLSAGRGVTHAAQNNQFSTFIGYQLTF